VTARLIWFNQVDSTSDEAKRQLADGRRPPFAIAASHQTAGRGRMGKSWVSPSGSSLLVTLAIEPLVPAHELAFASIAVGVSLADWLRHLGVPVALKWPNDLRVDGAKISGILCEQADGVLLVGVGVNWADAPRIPGCKTCAVLDFVDPGLDRSARVQDLVDRLLAGLNSWSELGNAPIAERFWSMAEREVRYEHAGAVGRPVGIADDGALWLEDATGKRHRVVAGILCDKEAECAS
jgi:BirA family transcriptional regulator, biotin operon repressor / biotin---[acetyl-CoA-carboxylase] ligase